MTNTATQLTWEQLTGALAQRIQADMDAAARPQWQALRSAVPAPLDEATCDNMFAAQFAEAILCVRTVNTWLTDDRLDVAPMWSWLRSTARPPFRQIFQAAVPTCGGGSADPLVRAVDAVCGDEVLTHVSQQMCAQAGGVDEPAQRIIQSYERLLHRHNRRRRGTYGVYYTPRTITSHIVRSIHELLRDEFDVADGLADTEAWHSVSPQGDHQVLADAKLPLPHLSVLDPAVGTGAFLVEVIDCVHGYLTAKWTAAGSDRAERAKLWHAHVQQHLLPHLHGWEIILPAAALAQVAIACQLASTGFDFRTDQPLQIHWKNALAAPAGDDHPRHTVILGNPPYSALSTNAHSWVKQLLHGDDRGRPTHDYFEVAGTPLGERKVWIHDDYVKFLRMAQWLLHPSSKGVLGFITNRGYLDNVTFRGVRYQLLQTFEAISVVDLHGGRKAHERTPAGDIDENIFDIEQGVAIGIFRRGGKKSGVDHIDVWGTRDHKEKYLAQHTCCELTGHAVTPRAPNFHLTPHDAPVYREYETAARLTQLMPTHTTAPVTARDGFVVAFTADELLRRMEQFADLSVSDDRIRETFFGSTRSRRYPPGDTRGWKLAEARRRMAQQTDLQSLVRSCWYRPFDRRKIVWADWMIDWPRSRVMSYFDQPGLALVARRQMLAYHPCNFFWVIDDLAVDGIIRSDNRGSESIFPLYAPQTRQANFDVTSPLAGEDPETALHYIYGLFHCPSYRTRYAAALRCDFPRVIVPQDRAVLQAFAQVGKKLVDLHLLRTTPALSGRWCGRGADLVARGYPQHHDDRVYINDQRWFAPVCHDVWDVHVGGHQVARKWMKDRRGRVLDDQERLTYENVIDALSQTLMCMQQIEDALAAFGKIDDIFR